MKKTIPVLLISICMAITATAPISAVAESAFVNFEGAGTSELQEIQKIEELLYEENTSVSLEMYKQIERYSELAKNAEGQELARLLSLIESSTRLLEKHQKVRGVAGTNEKTKTYARASSMKEEVVTREEVLQSAIASVISFFNTFNYRLSAELLTQMYANNSLDCLYYPVNANRTLQSTAVAEIMSKDVSAGTGAFENEGNDVQRDNYFSLHNFRYAKTKNGTLVITDRYDYSPNDNFGVIQDVPIQMMYEAQEKGLLTPYYVVIMSAPETGEEDFTSDYLSMKNGMVHIYNNASEEMCCVQSCAHERVLCDHIDGNEDKICDSCYGIVDHDFVCVHTPLIKEEDVDNFVGGVSGFFQNLFSKIAQGWNAFVEAIKNLFSFS